MPRGDYAALVALFNGLLATSLLAHKCSREPLPERVEPKDLALFALATQKLSRVITKDKVTSAFRAPFTEVEGKGGPGEVEERAKGHGLRRAIGELLTCPFCLGTWIASGFIYGLMTTGDPIRLMTSIGSQMAIPNITIVALVTATPTNANAVIVVGRPIACPSICERWLRA